MTYSLDDLMAQVSSLVAKVSALLGRRDNSQTEFAAWFGGAADGGPNGDGLFPLTDSTGYTRLVPSPERQMHDVGEEAQFNAATVSALPDAAKADADPAQNARLVGQRADGKVMRYAPQLIAARPLIRLQELAQGEYAEWISCLSSTGLERKIALEHLLSAVGNVIDPTHPPYNVVYDFKKQKGIQFGGGTNAIYSPYNACFGPSDIGKLLVASNGDQDGALEGYIGQVSSDGRTARIFTDLTFNTPKNAYYGQGFSECIWGTDCTAGMQRAIDDAEPVSLDMPGRVVVLGGIVLVRQLRFGSIAIVGLSPLSCGFAALPVPGSQVAWIKDKDTGQYGAGQKKPQFYTLKGLTFYGQFYTQHYSSFRRNLEIRGGGFYDFVTGAPYGRVEDIDIREAQWDGGFFDGAFGGQFNSVRLFSNNYCGMRMGFYDLNGQNWHAEGNRHTGIFSTMIGGNVATVRASFNGVGGSGDQYPHEHGSNYVEAGSGNTVTNLRSQESWAHNLCFSDVDTIAVRPGNGNKNKFLMGTFDDSGSISAHDPAHHSPNGLPGVRAMVYIKRQAGSPYEKGPHNNEVELVSGSPQVRPYNYATNAYGDEGDPRGNNVVLRTPGISNDPADWYDGTYLRAGDGSRTTTYTDDYGNTYPISPDLRAASPGPWMTSSSSSIAARGNQVSINGQTAP